MEQKASWINHCGNHSYATVAGSILYSTAFVTSTLPGIEANCSSTLPTSLYLASRPAWFDTSYGCVTWPPIDPLASTKVNKIPAQLCYENGPKTGGDFAPSTCYGTGVTPTPTPTPAATPHPADSNADYKMTANEVTTYDMGRSKINFNLLY